MRQMYKREGDVKMEQREMHTSPDMLTVTGVERGKEWVLLWSLRESVAQVTL